MSFDPLTSCACATWTRTQCEVLSHHPNCDKYDPEVELRQLLKQLIDGIDAWAADEDGVHPDCWAPYVKARAALGDPAPPRDSEQ